MSLAEYRRFSIVYLSNTNRNSGATKNPVRFGMYVEFVKVETPSLIRTIRRLTAHVTTRSDNLGGV
jgi:hypothetical protein